MSVTKVTLLALAILVTCSICCTASVPTIISYQGKLTQPSGDPFADGTYSITFSIYDVPNGGTAVWTGQLQRAGEGRIVQRSAGQRDPDSADSVLRA